MKIYSLIKPSIVSMLANKGRTFLTVLGMVIGVTAIMIVFSAGEGIYGLMLSQMESFGTDFIETEIKVPSTKRGFEGEAQGGINLLTGVQVTSLTLEDMEDINKIPNVKDSYADITGQEQVTYQEKRKKINLLGVSASYIDIDKSEIEEGRFFSESENRALSRVAVIGIKVKEDLFGQSSPLDKLIRIGKNKYRVIGTIKERGMIGGMDFDTFVYLPIKTTQKKLLGIDYVIYMFHKLVDNNKAEETAQEIVTILRENHDIISDIDPMTGEPTTAKDDFRVVTMDEMMEMLDTITGALTILLLAIVTISLIVGGVGIMNIMYVIVSERTREIGLRKAVGARFSDIMSQFLIESILITLVGAIFGIIIGFGMSWLIALGASVSGLDWNFIMPIRAYVVAILFSVIFGIAFGLFPARKAAKMDPITALRNE